MCTREHLKQPQDTSKRRPLLSTTPSEEERKTKARSWSLSSRCSSSCAKQKTLAAMNLMKKTSSRCPSSTSVLLLQRASSPESEEWEEWREVERLSLSSSWLDRSHLWELFLSSSTPLSSHSVIRISKHSLTSSTKISLRMGKPSLLMTLRES